MANKRAIIFCLVLNACGAVSVVAADAPAPSCPSGRTWCNGSCVNRQDDRTNCGACGVTCPTGRACMAGKCQACSGDEVVCANQCVKLDEDRDNCGGCGQACPAVQ